MTWAWPSWYEAFGFITGVLSVWLAVRENVWNWWIGIANNVLYVVVFTQARLFGDAGLQLVYIAISVWGIAQWLHGGVAAAPLRVRRVPVTEALGALAVLFLGSGAMAYYLARVNDAAPGLDALTTVGSLVAQYGLARKYLENWYLWIGVDAVSIGLYLWKGLPLTAVLYAVFLALCVTGVISWRRSLVPATV